MAAVAEHLEVTPTLEEARALAGDHNLVPVTHSFIEDCETPVSAFLKLRGDGPAFLLESAEQGQHVGRWSFIGWRPKRVLRWSLADGGDPYTLAARGRVRGPPGGDRRACRRSPAAPSASSASTACAPSSACREPNPDVIGLPDMALMLSDVIVAFDHLRHTVTILANAYLDDGTTSTPPTPAPSRRSARSAPGSPARCPRSSRTAPREEPVFEPNMPREAFEANVARIIEYIHAGDAYQVVPSPALVARRRPSSRSRSTAACARSTRARTCTSSTSRTSRSSARSPEPLLTVNGRHVSTRPIAGTRPRGEDDAAIAAELLADEKERAEHVMLVDLGRNDLGRVCEHGSVHVERLMEVETYCARDPHRLPGRGHAARRGRRDRRAAQRPARRHALAARRRSARWRSSTSSSRSSAAPTAARSAGSSYAGELDTCICIRTVVVKDGVAHVQAGGGTVADAKPDYEYEESRAKARGVVRAIELATQAGGVAVRVLMVDNYDSFTYNLVQYLGELGAELEVVRNDAPTVDELLEHRLRPRRRLARPVHAQRGRDQRRGHAPLPRGRRQDARRLPRPPVDRPGVRRHGRPPHPVHGKTTEITHDGEDIFAGLPDPLPVARYHSLVVDADLPDDLEADRPRRRRADGHAPPDAARDRRPVPSRVRAHARRQATAARTSWPMPNPS